MYNYYEEIKVKSKCFTNHFILLAGNIFKQMGAMRDKNPVYISGQLIEGQTVNIYTNSQCAFAVIHRNFPGGAVVKNLPANTGDVRDVGSIPGQQGSSGVGSGNPIQYSWKIPWTEEPGRLHGVEKSWT